MVSRDLNRLRTRRANIHYGKDYSQRRESSVRMNIHLQFSRHSLLYSGRLKAPNCFIQGFIATNFSEHTRRQTEYDITAIHLASIISIVTPLNS